LAHAVQQGVQRVRLCSPAQLDRSISAYNPAGYRAWDVQLLSTAAVRACLDTVDLRAALDSRQGSRPAINLTCQAQFVRQAHFSQQAPERRGWLGNASGD
jgi:hypothetical protein